MNRAPRAAQPAIADVPRRMARADVRLSDMPIGDVRKADDDDERRAIGRAIDQARLAVGWTIDQLARHVGVDAREAARWCNGSRRPQFDRLLRVPELRGPVLLALVRLAPEHFEVVTTIRYREAVTA